MVFDADDAVAQVHKPVQHAEQLSQIVEVQPGRRLVENVNRLAGRGASQFGRELQTLRLATRQRRRALPKRQVAEAHVIERLQEPPDLRHIDQMREGRADRHLQNLGDVLALVAHLQRLALIAFPAAGLARHPHVRQEVHLVADLPEPFAIVASPAGPVEAESVDGVAADLAVGQTGEDLADDVEDAAVRRRVGERRVADRLLIDVDDLVDEVQPADFVMRSGRQPRALNPRRQGGVQNLGDER